MLWNGQTILFPAYRILKRGESDYYFVISDTQKKEDVYYEKESYFTEKAAMCAARDFIVRNRL